MTSHNRYWCHRYCCRQEPPESLNILLNMATESDMSASCKVILAATVAKSLQAEVTEGLSELEKAPSLVGFLANNDPGARLYADWTAKTCREK